MVLEDLEEEKAYCIEYSDGRGYVGRILKNQERFSNPIIVIDESFERMYVFDKLLQERDIRLSGRIPVFRKNGKFVSLDGGEVIIEVVSEGDIEGLVGSE